MKLSHMCVIGMLRTRKVCDKDQRAYLVPLFTAWQGRQKEVFSCCMERGGGKAEAGTEERHIQKRQTEGGWDSGKTTSSSTLTPTPAPISTQI
jgi:hypothetical protein